MQLLTSAPATLSQTLVSASLPQASAPQRPKLKMVRYKEWDGKRERMVAQ